MVTSKSVMPSVSLTKGLGQVIKRLKATGRYANTSEIVRAGLRLLEKQELNDYLNPPPLPPGTMEKIYARETAAERHAEEAAGDASIRALKKALRKQKLEEL